MSSILEQAGEKWQQAGQGWRERERPFAFARCPVFYINPCGEQTLRSSLPIQPHELMAAGAQDQEPWAEKLGRGPSPIVGPRRDTTATGRGWGSMEVGSGGQAGHGPWPIGGTWHVVSSGCGAFWPQHFGWRPHGVVVHIFDCVIVQFVAP
eukprot:7474368-Pyramimonas_sp.AAC.1